MFVRLFRDSFETPWGFRLQGGKDIGYPLTVQRVFSNSPAEGELQRGDVILSINGRDANTLSHKQALDNIKFGGGQIELKVNRPPSGVSIKHIQPTSPTRAPQIFQEKTAPLKLPVRRASDHGPQTMPPPAIAGHQPRKITMNKFGGGISNFGTNYGSRAQQPGWQPQPSIYSEQYTPQPSMQQGYGDNYQQPHYQPMAFNQPQPPYQPQTQYQPPSPQPLPTSPQPQQQAYIPKYQSPGLSQPDYVRAEDPVEEEEYEYVPVSQRKQSFVEKKSAPAGDYYVAEGEESYYPNCPVWERRKLFMRDQPKAIRPRKTKPFTVQTSSYSSFGTDYSKKAQQQQQAPQPVQQQRPRPPPVTQVPVNAAPVMMDEPDTSSSSSVWKGTLRSSGGPKPWEQENAAAEYIMPSQREAMQHSPRPKPPVSPKPVRPQQQSAQQASPQKQIIVRSVPEGRPQEGPKAVHLQYNSPMGLYSNANVQEAYSVQTHDPTSSTVSKPKQEQAGDRDWNQSHVYRMIQDTKKETRTTQQGQGPPIKTTTYQSSQKTYNYTPTFEDGYGVSDF